MQLHVSPKADLQSSCISGATEGITESGLGKCGERSDRELGAGCAPGRVGLLFPWRRPPLAQIHIPEIAGTPREEGASCSEARGRRPSAGAAGEPPAPADVGFLGALEIPQFLCTVGSACHDLFLS